mmetsp:Transcript_62905/g.183975  ORF Transcript_62905/g.183975 Transcript_62905/m.183975 type:complete len:256 (+) Transcript_62905:947-1714(+)
MSFRIASRTSVRYGASSSFLHFLTMAFNAFTPLAKVSGSESARAGGSTAGSAVGSTETTSSEVRSKNRSKSLTPAARRDAESSSLMAPMSSAKRRLRPDCSTRSMTRVAESTAASRTSGSASSSLATPIMTGSTSERCRCTVWLSGITASAERPWSCIFVKPSSPGTVRRLKTMGSTAPGCLASSFSRPLMKRWPCSSTSSSSSWSCASTHVTTSVVARGPTALCSSATTLLAELRTVSTSSMMAWRMAGIKSPK